MKENLEKIVGSEYVSDDSTICYSYSRDQHWNFVPAKSPACVVMPGTREEVRKILLFANKNRIPVIPWSTGINVRGLTIPVHDNSILLDLSRLNRIIEINEEMMTATVEPAVTFGMLMGAAFAHNLNFAAAPDKFDSAKLLVIGGPSVWGQSAVLIGLIITLAIGFSMRERIR